MIPDLSIIIPCFNRVDLLKATLKSVGEAIKGISAEIILVDDGSRHPIAGQLEEFSYLPMKVIRQANSGLTASRYRGLQEATGTYIQFLDSDDLVAADKFNRQLEAMKTTGADVSYTDIVEREPDPSQPSGFLEKNATARVASTAPDFYINIQPPPHSPVFSRYYLMKTLQQAFIPLNRNYDSIGEVWFYYNLAPFKAKIIKVTGPLTIIVHHPEERLTDHWELQGLCALALQKELSRRLPVELAYSKEVRLLVAASAFETFRRLPYQIDSKFSNAFVDTWRELGGTRKLNGGKGFKILTALLGPVKAAQIIKILTSKKDYQQMKSIDPADLEVRLKTVLDSFNDIKI